MTDDRHLTKRNGTQTRKRKLLSPDLRKDLFDYGIEWENLRVLS